MTKETKQFHLICTMLMMRDVGCRPAEVNAPPSISCTWGFNVIYTPGTRKLNWCPDPVSRPRAERGQGHLIHVVQMNTVAVVGTMGQTPPRPQGLQNGKYKGLGLGLGFEDG
jgi:hypothetical protein